MKKFSSGTRRRHEILEITERVEGMLPEVSGICFLSVLQTTAPGRRRVLQYETTKINVRLPSRLHPNCASNFFESPSQVFAAQI